MKWRAAFMNYVANKMEAILDYQRLVNEMNAKELELENKIRFYKENREQVLRIKFLEDELQGLVLSIDNDYRNKVEEIRQQKIKDEKIKLIGENCERAFKMLETQRDLRGIIDISKVPNEITCISKYSGHIYCTYFFEEVNGHKYYNVKYILNRNHREPMYGSYSKTEGFKEK